MKEEEIRPKAIFDEYLRLAEEDIKQFFSDKSSFVRIKCPACSEDNETFEFEKKGFRYVRCNRCGTLYVNPRPSEEAIRNFYTHSRSTKYFAEHFYKETEAQRREKIFKPRALMIRDFVGPTKLATFADIGAGYGTFLEEIRDLNLFEKIIAIEPSEDLVPILKNKGFEVIQKPIEECGIILKNKVNLATSFELLEHVFSPEKFFSSVWQILSEGGYFIFTSLNINGFDLLVLWEKSKSISPPHHLNFLNLQSAKILLERCGFRVVKMFTPGKLDVDIVRNMYLDKKVELDRFVKFLINSDEKTRMNFQTFLTENNLSSHMSFIAQKIVR
jgi:SAM-dependent methyltransferase/ribosomal protein S27E